MGILPALEAALELLSLAILDLPRARLQTYGGKCNIALGCPALKPWPVSEILHDIWSTDPLTCFATLLPKEETIAILRQALRKVVDGRSQDHYG